MDRIAITGCGGSGKSRLARQLGELLGIVPVHLDAVYYDQTGSHWARTSSPRDSAS